MNDSGTLTEQWFRVASPLIFLWVALCGALLYLELPALHSLTIASAIVSQASLGAFTLSRLLKWAPLCLLVLCGPGLIVGGALSVAAFQLAGRGVPGLLASWALGVFALISLLRGHSKSDKSEEGWGLISLLLGCAALAMSSEFESLLVAGISLLLSYVILATHRETDICIRAIVVIVAVLLLYLGRAVRGEWWWLVTDDYKLFETMSHHLRTSGPLETWGTVSFLRYHWLSYAWSGLIEFAAFGPETQVVLTRVMPLIYSISLAASILLITRLITGVPSVSPLAMLPACATLSVFRLDWSGTSTAAAMSVLTAAVAVCAGIADAKLSISRRLGIYSLLSPVVLLTKMPSFLALIVLLIATEVFSYCNRRSTITQLAVTLTAVTLTGMMTLLSLPMLTERVGGFSIAWGDLRGDELSRRGLATVLITLFARQVWLILAIALVWFLTTRLKPNRLESRASVLLVCLSPLLAVAITFDAIVVGVANTNEYFSGPMYLLVGLNLLTASRVLLRSSVVNVGAISNLIAGTTVGLSMLVARMVDTAILPELPGSALLRVGLSDPRVIFGLVVVIGLVTRQGVVLRSTELLLTSLFTVFLIVGLGGAASRLINDGVQPVTSDVTLVRLLGAPDGQTVGLWLSNNTHESDLIATNHLRDRAGQLGTDFTLGMWSERPFLVLGPKLGFESLQQSAAITASEDFAVSASGTSAEYLLSQGVDYFVVDLDTTSLRSWEPYADVVAMTWRFWVLKMRP